MMIRSRTRSERSNWGHIGETDQGFDLGGTSVGPLSRVVSRSES